MRSGTKLRKRTRLRRSGVPCGANVPMSLQLTTPQPSQLTTQFVPWRDTRTNTVPIMRPPPIPYTAYRLRRREKRAVTKAVQKMKVGTRTPPQMVTKGRMSNATGLPSTNR